jgi:membrane protein required for colicin V production
MNTLDLFLLIPIALGFIFGIFKGLIKELTSLAAIVLGIYGAKFFASSVSEILINSFGFSPKTAQPIAYIFLFILIAIVLLILANMVDKFFSSISLGGLNKFMGGLFGGLKYALIVSVLLNVFDALDSRFSILGIETKQESIGYKPLMKLGPTLWDEAQKRKENATGNETVYETSEIK